MAILTIPTTNDLAMFVSAYALGSLKEAHGIEAGTVNTSYSLELDAGRFFLRIYEEQDAEGAAREANVLGHLAAKGVLTPAPVVARDGAAMRMVAGKPAALFPWIDGDIVCQGRVTTFHANAVGEALAQIHVAGHAKDAPLDGGRFGPRELAVRCDRVTLSRDDEARALAESLRAAVLRVGERREGRVRSPSGLIHGDLFRDNVLWQQVPSPNVKNDHSAVEAAPCRIAALLDFESAHDGPFAYDLAVTILSWSFGSTFDMNVARAIVQGYRRVRELEQGDRDALYDESIFAALRFTITRITDEAIRVGKRWQRFVARREALEALGPERFLEALGL